MPITKAAPDDVFLWSDGTWCFRFERENGGYDHMSDDYRILQPNTQEYEEFFS